MARRVSSYPTSGGELPFHGKQHDGGEVPIFTVDISWPPVRGVSGRHEYEVTFTCPYCKTGNLRPGGRRSGKAAVHRHGAPANWDGSPMHKAAHCWDGPMRSYWLIAA